MEIVFGIIVLILSVVIHEVSHGYAAEALGDPTARLQGRLTLNPLRHLDPMGSVLVPLITWFAGGFIFGWAKPVPYNPYNLRNQKWGEALVAAAGPASNIVFALIFGFIMRLTPVSGTLLEILSFVVLINIVLAVFNLVPIPPLDGSKILFALLPYRYGAVRAFLERYGLIVVLLFILFLWRLIVPVISFLFSLITGTGF
ncbi:site-2 protease family protein [Candidatus Wolfebacteria bacterium]|nr:site-2 protease family protein [Candidatus Wolfebacteria bacterium]